MPSSPAAEWWLTTNKLMELHNLLYVHTYEKGPRVEGTLNQVQIDAALVVLDGLRSEIHEAINHTTPVV